MFYVFREKKKVKFSYLVKKRKRKHRKEFKFIKRNMTRKPLALNI